MTVNKNVLNWIEMKVMSLKQNIFTKYKHSLSFFVFSLIHVVIMNYYYSSPYIQ